MAGVATLGGSSPSNFVLAENGLGCHQVASQMVLERLAHPLYHLKLVTLREHPVLLPQLAGGEASVQTGARTWQQLVSHAQGSAGRQGLGLCAPGPDAAPHQ